MQKNNDCQTNQLMKYEREYIMKKLLLTVASLSLMASASSAIAAADETVTASAVWQAEATKQSQSSLVITPIRTLQFKYSENSKSFNQDTGTFDVAIRGGRPDANAFKLEARVDDGNNVLRQVGGESTLAVGALFGSKELGSTLGGSTGVGKNADWTTLVDSMEETGNGSSLWALTKSAKGKPEDKYNARDNFKFIVKKATSDGTTSTSFADLSDGLWTGEVAVAFRATWSE
ncbi:common pilus major fimbrillin subunit EcpA [Erwinia persicina]|uniref:common pilus major fimbrillin subunit EcpA n=1 Tax=Erwinia persicina TaxID=55211 RepID=UPI0039AFD584